ncbi:MAG: hypothetical protein ACLPVY_27575 [Acidimicrobiia bacterium]
MDTVLAGRSVALVDVIASTASIADAIRLLRAAGGILVAVGA